MFLDFINSRKKEIFFFTILIIFFYRSPFIFLNGRFMAEEGSLYFANAYRFDFIYSLFFVDFRSGYMNLWANISGIISNLFSLRIAPLISNYLSLVPKVLIIYFILYGKSLLFQNLNYRILFCCLIFLTPFNVPEIWMNSINSQIFFCILSLQLVFLEYDKKKIDYFNLSIVLISGLSGIYSCILTPVFFFKYLIFKSFQDKFNLIIITISSIIQFSLILYSKLNNLVHSTKIHSIDLELIYNFTYNVLIKSFLGINLTKYIFYKLEIELYYLVILIFIILITLFFLIKKILKDKQINNVDNFIIKSFIFIFVMTSLTVMVGATEKYVGGRYAALPSFYLLAFILFLIRLINKNKMIYVLMPLIVISIFTGIYEFRPKIKVGERNYLKLLDCINCPDWKQEVEIFKNDNNYNLKIWPYPNKTMKLN